MALHQTVIEVLTERVSDPAMSDTEIDHGKLDLQEMEYAQPVHWRMGKVDGNRYKALSRVISDTICKLPPVARMRKVLIIDLGCGDGAGTWQMFNLIQDRRMDVRVHGSDYSETAVKWAREMTKENTSDRLEFEVASAEGAVQLPLNGYPLVVVMREVIEHLTEAQFADVVNGLRRLYDSGYLILTTPTVNSPTDAKHYRHYDGDLIDKWLADNNLSKESVFGFAFRPRFLYSILARLKSILNTRPLLWRMMTPLWRKVPLGTAQTVVAVGSWSAR
jgi:2-polyprenyl-3-methyl-5-hydroxy-6-metoxy-1,4-benzoquinol methylase